MTNPLLVDNFKFDIRLYVLITSCDPLKIFLYHEGIARLATEEFKLDVTDPANLENLYIHLTNYAINKGNTEKFHSPDNPFEDVGHKRSFSTVLYRLEEEVGLDAEKLLE